MVYPPRAFKKKIVIHHKIQGRNNRNSGVYVMKVMVDIPHEALFKAVEEINKKRDICKILPKARFYCDTEDFMFGGAGM